MTQQTLENWSEKAKRLALAVKATRPTDESPSAKQRLAHRNAKYELQLHLEAVPE